MSHAPFVPGPGRIALYARSSDPAPSIASTTRPRTVTVHEAALALGVGERTLRDAIKRGTAPVQVIRVMSVPRVVTASLDALLSGRTLAS